MYKVYINGTSVFLCSPEEAATAAFQAGKNKFNARYTGKKKMIKQYLDLLDKNKDVRQLVLSYPEPETLWQDFQACFRVLEAAGGYVVNSRGELLVFYRRDSWDMPKGKIDPGETPEQAALREVREETGLQQLDMGAFLCHTYHTYPQKGERILKKTWWYRMQTTDEQLIPQTEEDIVEIRWVAPETWLAAGPVVYESILDVIQSGQKG